MTTLQDAPPTTKWEYRTTVQTGGFMGRKSEELHRTELADVLTQHGNAGWELAWILMDQNLHREKDGHVLVFKRPVTSGS